MNTRRLRAVGVQTVLAPAVTLLVVAGAATAAGADPGIALLVVSMVSAAGTAGLLLSQTRSMQPDDDDGSPTGRDERTAVGLRSSLTDDPDVDRSRQAVVTRYAAGLFVQSAGLVLYLGGLFG